MNTFDLALDLDKRAGVTQWVTLRQGDHNGTVLKATIYDHGVQVGGGYTCRVSIRHPGTGETYYRETANYSNGVATVTIDEQYAAAIVGITSGYFELLQGSAVIASTEDFGVRILRSATDGAVPGEKYDSAIEDALAELDEATGRISQMVVDATEEYLEAHPEITTTVQDNSLTDAKLVQRGGILSRVERLWYRLANLLTATPAEADVLTVSDAAKTPLAGLSLYGRSTQDGTPTPDAPVAIESVTTNLVDYLTNYTSSQVRLEDGKLFNLITDSKSYASLVVQTFLKGTLQERYFISDNTSVGGTYAKVITTTKAFDSVRFKHNGSTHDVEFLDQLISGDAGDTYYVTITLFGVNPSVVGGLSVGMIGLFTGSEIRAYAPYDSVGVLTKGKNQLDLSRYSAYTHEVGITWTVNEDGSVSAKGTSTALSQAYWRIPKADIALFDRMVLSGCPNVSGCSIRIELAQSPYTAFALDQGSGATINVPSGNAYDVNIMCRVESGKTVDVTFRPMIRPAGSSAEFQPYAESVIPIDLQGHVLRSLPDETRDEVTVDEYGRATLVQRVGSYTVTGSESSISDTAQMANGIYRLRANNVLSPVAPTDSGRALCTHAPVNPVWASATVHIYVTGNSLYLYATASSAAEVLAAYAGAEVIYALATPQTIDLGTVDPIPLQGPDMTAQAVPTAPFELTYERDLNVTLARLEAAIADAATN